MKIPKTLQEAVVFFADPAYCQDFMIAMRWPDGKVVCPRCGSENVSYLENARLYKCYAKHEKAKFSLKVGTIFEDSAIGLDKWLMAMWLIVNAKNGISSYEIHRAIGITQKSAWHVLHRIRTAMTNGSIEKMSGTVEVDEAYIGGKASNMHLSKRLRFQSRWTRQMNENKTAVFGMVQRDGKVRAKILKNVSTKDVMPVIQENIAETSEVFTDQAIIYRDLWENTFTRPLTILSSMFAGTFIPTESRTSGAC